MAFTYPSDLIPKLRSIWKQRSIPRERIPRLPNGEFLANFLEVAYHAGFLAEEQRRLGFRLAYFSRRNALRKPQHRVFDSFAPVAFDCLRDFAVGEILRLAPATDLTRTLICVEPSAGHRTISKLQIWGMLDTGGSWWQFSHHESDSGRPPPNCLTVSCSEPGNLTISREGRILLILRSGELAQPSRFTLWEDPVADFFRAAQSTLYQNACERLGDSKWDTEGADDDYPHRFYTMFLERILHQIREKHHDGTLLVFPEEIGSTDSRLTDRVNIKYPSDYNRSWALLLEHLRLHRQYFDLHFKVWDRKSPVPIDLYHQVSIMESQRAEVDLAIADSVNLLAALSGVDGAVAISDRLRLLGFGAEVIAVSLTLSEVFVATDSSGTKGSSVSLESFGTRHRSAFRLCSSYENAVAFVVSQDGGTKVVRRVGDKVVMWPDVDVLPYGL